MLRWDGRAAVQRGDRLRLEVAGRSFSHLTVVTPQDAERLRILYSGALTPESGLLPTSWQVDDCGESETLIVIFSHRPLGDPESLRSELRRSELRRSDLSVRELVLPKAGQVR